MPSTFTNFLRFIRQATGENENTWGNLANIDFDLIDSAIAGKTEKNVTGSGDITLSTANGNSDEARQCSLVFTGTPSASRNVIIPASPKAYHIIANQTDYPIVIKTVADSGVSFPPGTRGTVYCDGDVVYKTGAPEDANALKSSNNLSDVADVSAARSNLSVYSVAQVDAIVSNTTSALQRLYPVGSIYMNATNATNPGTLLGFGTWVTFGSGRVLIGEGTGVDVNTVSAVFSAGSTGGEYSHTLSEQELPEFDILPFGTRVYSTAFVTGSTGASNHGSGSAPAWNVGKGGNPLNVDWSIGGNTPHNNVQPYVTVYMWRRTV